MANLKYWDFKYYSEAKWFRSLILMLLSIAALYSLLHLLNVGDKYGYEYSALNSKQIQQLNRIYFNTDTVVAAKSVDSLSKEAAALQKKFNDSCLARRGLRSERALKYIDNEFNGEIEAKQMDSIRSYLCCCMNLEAVSFLSEFRFRVKSYFWLTGPLSYVEIIFWTWFGVLCSLLFNLGVVGKNSTTSPDNPSSVFDSSEIPSQAARLAYAPCCTLIIVLGYNYFSNQNLPDIGSNKGMIVFAFVGGFYTSRLIALLDRIKDVLFPNSGKNELPENKQGALRNLLISVGLDDTIPAAVRGTISLADLSTATVMLKSTSGEQTYQAVNMMKDSVLLFMVDFVRQGTYTLTASWTRKEEASNLVLAAEQAVEIKDKDLVISVLLKQS